MTRNASLFPSLTLSLALVASLALPAAADRREDRAALQDLSESACSLGQAVEDALSAIPGTVARARLKRSRKPGQEAIWFYKVVSFDDAAERQVQRFDAATCDAVDPVAPSVDMPTAIATALEELGGGFPVASRLRFPGLEPVYRIVALRPRAKMVVYVDGVTGEVLASRRWSRKLDQAQDVADEEAEDSSL
jgi:uncharacterized iron-regulated membrane protein